MSTPNDKNAHTIPDFERLGSLLGDACDGAVREKSAGGRPRSSDPAQLLAAEWPDVVGSEVAANARPVNLQRGRLTVTVSSAAWAQTLQFMSEAIATKLNERLGERLVEHLVFRHAGWEDRPSGRDSRPPEPDGGVPGAHLSADQSQAIEDLERLGLPAELRARIARAMAAAFVRGEGDPVR